MSTPLARVAYICSSGRSGSTLLNMMLGTHPAFFGVGEIEHLPKNVALDTACTCGAAVSACPFWTEVFTLLRQRLGVNIPAAPYSFELGLLRGTRVVDPTYQTRSYLIKRKLLLGIKLAEYLHGLRLAPAWMMRGYEQRLSNTFQLFEAVAEVSGCSGVVDSSKLYGRAVSLYQRAPEKVRLLVLVRDGRAVYNAALRTGLSRPASLKFWKGYFERALPVLQRNVDARHQHVLKYEDLAADAEPTMRRLCDFLEIDFDPAMLAFRSGTKHILNGNEMRHGSNRGIQLDERWKQELSAGDLDYFIRHGGGAMNSSLGYR